MHRRIFVLSLAGLVLGGLIAAGVYLWQTFEKPHATSTGPVGPGIHIRNQIKVPPIRFTDVTEPAGIHFRHTNGATPQKLLPETMGGGVAFLDFDNDGKQDILFVNSCEWPGGEKGDRPTLALYHNNGDGTFTDVTEKSGLDVTFFGMGVTVGDYDNDGFVDVFVSGVGEQRLFHNHNGERFDDVTDRMGLSIGHLPDVTRKEFLAWDKAIPFGSSCTWVDYDGDGKLDLFVCHYVTWSPQIDLGIGAALQGGDRAYNRPTEFEGALCSLYHNEGGRFHDVSETAGVAVTDRVGVAADAPPRKVGKSLGVIVCDPDGDGWPDLLVANDTTRNFFFRNRPDAALGRAFTEDGVACGAGYAEGGAVRGGMGIDWGEFRPGKHAAVIANFADEPNTFLGLDNPRPLFTDTALSVGLAGPSRLRLKFGACFFDYDLDGRLDLLTCNGHIEPDIAKIQTSQTYAQAAQLFWNSGDAAGICFGEVTEKDAGPDLFRPLVGRGCAFADVDGDGDLDVVLVGNGGPARLLRNDLLASGGRQPPGPPHWVRLVLKGDGVKTNTSAIGAQVTIEIGDRKLKRQVTAGRGYLSQSELPITVGLGPAEKVDRVTVRWPGRDAKPEVWTNLAADRAYELKQGEPNAN